jgi:hypothetical protein
MRKRDLEMNMKDYEDEVDHNDISLEISRLSKIYKMLEDFEREIKR